MINLIKPGSNKFHLLLSMIIFAAIALVSSLVIYVSPITDASFVVDVRSKTTGDSQVFYATDFAYEQDKSVWQHIDVGAETLVFPLKGSYSSLRWDPLDGSGAIEVKDAHISILSRRIDLDPIVLEPLYQVAAVDRIGGWTRIDTTEGAIDPQVNVVVDFIAIKKYRIVISLILGLSTAVVSAFLLYFRNEFVRCSERVDGALRHELNKLRNDGLNFKELAYLTGIGATLYVYFLSTFSISIDDEMAALRQDPSGWVAQGRWFVYFVEKYIFPHSSIPFAPYILLICSLALSYAFFLRAHSQVPSWRTYFVYPVYAAFPTWWFISEFYSNVPALAFSILFVSYSAYLAFRDIDAVPKSFRATLGQTGIIVVLLACAIGAYQSLILLYISLVFGILLFRAKSSLDTEGKILRISVFELVKNMFVVIGAVLLYGVINKISQILIAPDSGYIANFMDLSALVTSPVRVILSVVGEMEMLYGGSEARYGVSIGMSVLIMVASTLCLLSQGVWKGATKLMLWAGVVVSPFLLNFISGGQPLPIRSMLAIAYVAWTACLLLISNKRPSLIALGVGIVALYQIQIFSLNSQYMVSATITQAHDRMLAADIYQRIGEINSAFDRTAPLEIDVFGKKAVNTVYASGWSSAMQGSFFSWDEGNLNRMVKYMRVMGYENISTPSIDVRISLSPIFNEMPIWPAAGSVVYNSGRYLVRLSREPDSVHARYVR